MLNGQRLQGPETAKEVNVLLKAKNMEAEYVINAIEFNNSFISSSSSFT